MIALSSPTYDPSGHIFIDSRFENPFEAQRRGSVTATLDGNSVTYDTGYSISDLTLRATVNNPTKTMLETLRYLVAYYSQIVVACEIGVFRAVLEVSMPTGNRATIRCRLLSRLDSGV